MPLDKNGIFYTEEELENFLEADLDDLSSGILPEVTLCIRKYPKRYLISFEIDWDNPLEPAPVDAEDAALLYTPPKAYLWPDRYLHRDFEQNRATVLAKIKTEIQQKFRR